MLLELNKVAFSYHDKSIFGQVSLTIHAGELLVINGPSGSGKSTLLRLLNRLQDPQKGIINFQDRPLDQYPVTELRRQIFYLQQSPLMIEGSVADNLLLPFHFHAAGRTQPPAEDELRRLLDRLQLSGVALDGSAAELSLGQKQRLAFIRALLLKPQVLLLDEPVSSLDPESRAIVQNQVESLVAEQGLTALLVTHLDFAPTELKARRFQLSGGRLREQL